MDLIRAVVSEIRTGANVPEIGQGQAQSLRLFAHTNHWWKIKAT